MRKELKLEDLPGSNKSKKKNTKPCRNCFERPYLITSQRIGPNRLIDFFSKTDRLLLKKVVRQEFPDFDENPAGHRKQVRYDMVRRISRAKQFL